MGFAWCLRSALCHVCRVRQVLLRILKVFELSQNPGTEHEGRQAEAILVRELSKHGLDRSRLLAHVMQSSAAPDPRSMCSEDTVTVPHTVRHAWTWGLANAICHLFPLVKYFATSGSAKRNTRATFTFYGEARESNSAAHLFADLWLRTMRGGADYIRAEGTGCRGGVGCGGASGSGRSQGADGTSSSRPATQARVAVDSYRRGVGDFFYRRCVRIGADRKEMDIVGGGSALALVTGALTVVAREVMVETHGKMRKIQVSSLKHLDRAAYKAGGVASRTLPINNGDVKDKL